ncbi:DNA-3-methyladenine glycosylase I [Lentibacillus sp. JNUCC-1]|uniref:DNA-3-methyladenine glycosylase I n=1 Tax=Lentibacillus sp. JNUCC-1 TaxID=2654513 RepID=UPI0012E7F533|nr:DNA-3-methyladenine glycosylase I [Lentibacillus sp. JNUCC-1]MUV38377.1 DNA-3-methyladenine glycosylase I [Lentibacillus sp. JNUCC-1]
MLERCQWAGPDPLYIEYHDHEWGRPHHEDRHLFEMLCLEGAQAGLSWITILKRRDNYRRAFDEFDPKLVSQYDEAKIQSLLKDEGIIRNERKIRSVVKNAQAFLRIQEAYGSFDAYIWQFVGGTPVLNNWPTHEDVPAYTEESTAMSKDLKKRGFSFVGPTICYAYMQATGMVNDHTMNCFLYHGKKDEAQA